MTILCESCTKVTVPPEDYSNSFSFSSRTEQMTSNGDKQFTNFSRFTVIFLTISGTFTPIIDFFLAEFILLSIIFFHYFLFIIHFAKNFYIQHFSLYENSKDFEGYH